MGLRNRVCKECLFCKSEEHGKVKWYRCVAHGGERVSLTQYGCCDFVKLSGIEKMIESAINNAKDRGYLDVAKRGEALYSENKLVDAWLYLNSELYENTGGWNHTTVQQSKVLDDLGSSRESADGFFISQPNGYEWNSTPIFDEEHWQYSYTLPCWSVESMFRIILNGIGDNKITVVGQDKFFKVCCIKPLGASLETKSDISLTDAVFKMLVLLVKEKIICIPKD